MLPQGEFARFLHDKPAARQDLLVQLLGLDVYERMMRSASTIANDTRTAIAKDQDRIEALAGATPETRVGLAGHVVACTEARARWRDRQPELVRLHGAAEVADGEAAVATRRVEKLRGVAAPPDLDALTEALGAATAELETARADVDRLGAQVVSEETAVAGAGSRDELVAARDAYEQHAVTEKALITARGRAERAASALDAATGAAAAAEAHVEVVRTGNAAVVVREQLRRGEPCPVCEQIVTDVPAVGGISDLQVARAAEREARAAADEALGAHREAVTRVADGEEALDRLREQLSTALTGCRGRGGAGRPRRTRRQADGIAPAPNRPLAPGRRPRPMPLRPRTAGRNARRDRYRERRDDLATMGLTPPPETDDLVEDWSSLLGWVGTEMQLHVAAAQAATDRAAEARVAVRAELAAVAADAAALELAVPVDADFDDLVAAVERAVAVTEERITRLDADIKERAALIEATAARTAEADVAAELAHLLDAGHFERWLVSEALSRLVAGGSERLDELSGGRYSFTMDDAGRDLLVVDHAHADERRPVRTLSGGETFQASLALALALSDQLADLAADGAARLESIFLDEGFGTLDAETLETVASTIENLAAGDRMVGIVTHVPELAARIPVQFRVTSGGRTATVERVMT